MPLNRREFLKAAAATVTVITVPSCSEDRSPARTYAANEKVNVACVGVGGQGTVNRNELAPLSSIVALCDVDQGTLEKAAKNHPGAKLWNDYREMLEKQQKEIDAVMISTPDHIHAPAAMMAMKLGKGVDVEKPMAHNVYETRAMSKAAKKYKVATQMDNEGHATEGLRAVVEWVKDGAIGTVREVHIWTDRPIWPQGIKERPATKTVPPNLKWDLWLGPAPVREYHEHLHPFQWRGWWDFGCGALGDMGCHFFDSTVWALELEPPISVEAVHEGNSKETGPNWAVITYEFAARKGKGGNQEGKDLPPVTVKWYDGHKQPPRPEELEADRKMPPNGSMFVGDKGKILVADTSSARIIPESKMKEYKRPAPFIPRVAGHKQDWLEAVKGVRPAGCDFALYGSKLAEIVLLGNLAVRAGQKIEWDSENLKAKNCPAADEFIRREYRKGWEL
ncbi:MAG TPA: Gfo/Idh/MocA family oxidoreductase [Planctomycetota bacterium]|jgi:predicted dehydrogenase